MSWLDEGARSSPPVVSQQLCLWLWRCYSGWLRAAWDPTLRMSVAGQGPALLGSRTSEHKHWAPAPRVVVCFTVTWLEDWKQESLCWCRSLLETEHVCCPLGAQSHSVEAVDGKSPSSCILTLWSCRKSWEIAWKSHYVSNQPAEIAHDRFRRCLVTHLIQMWKY